MKFGRETRPSIPVATAILKGSEERCRIRPAGRGISGSDASFRNGAHPTPVRGR